MENLGSMSDSQCTGYHKIMDHNIFDLQCTTLGPAPLNY